jgi:hypothetical protein
LAYLERRSCEAENMPLPDLIFCCNNILKLCNPEEFDYPILNKEPAEAHIPLLHIEIEQQMDSSEQIRARGTPAS